MRKRLRIAGLLLLLTALGAWLGRGANRGWTKTSVPVKKLDEVTGLEGIEYRRRFVPGVDFLGAAVLAAGTLTGCSFLFRHAPSEPEPKP